MAKISPSKLLPRDAKGRAEQANTRPVLPDGQPIVISAATLNNPDIAAHTPLSSTVNGKPVNKIDLYHDRQQKQWSQEEIIIETTKCLNSSVYFVHNYCYIEDRSSGDVFRFDLWPDQMKVLRAFESNKMVIVLKPRQIGMTWLALCYALWLVLFKPGVTVLLFSLRDDEAQELLTRLRNVYNRLPKWLQCREVTKSDAHDFWLSNNSQVKAFPTGKGDSYTATLAIFDEADLPEDKMQKKMMLSIKPTIDRGGQLFLISKVDKSKPNSSFKKIYHAAKKGENGYKPIFLPWYSNPGFSQERYDKEKKSLFANTGSNDALYETYPETDAQALAPVELDKRIPADWLIQCYKEDTNRFGPKDFLPTLRHIRGLNVYKEPVRGRKYIGAIDPAEGNPTSDPSALVILDHLTGEEVASLSEKLTPRRIAEFAEDLSKVFNNCSYLVERNNHGGSVIQWLQDNTKVRLLEGMDGKPGWPETRKSKEMLYDYSSELFRDGTTQIHTFEAYTQLCSIEGDTIRAPEGDHDDLAIAYVLALVAIKLDRYGRFKPEDFQFADTRNERPFGVVFGDMISSPFGMN